MGRPAKHPIQEFNGVRYYRKSGGYYQATHRLGGQYIHRVVWAHHNGPIPKGWQVHHIDHDPANNAIENLELHDGGDHATFHYESGASIKPFACKEWLDTIRHLAAEARRDPEVVARMAESQRRAWDRRESVTRQCTYCGKDYPARGTAKKGFCGMSCQGMARKKSGVDDIERSCLHCQAVFRSNKHNGSRCCSRSCSGKVAAAKRSAGKGL